MKKKTVSAVRLFFSVFLFYFVKKVRKALYAL